MLCRVNKNIRNEVKTEIYDYLETASTHLERTNFVLKNGNVYNIKSLTEMLDLIHDDIKQAWERLKRL